MSLEFILTKSNNLSTHEKRVLGGLCVNKGFGAWVWKNDVLIALCKKEDNFIIGWAAFQPINFFIPKNKKERELIKKANKVGNISVYVRKEYRGNGIGSRLVKMLMDKNKKSLLYCAPREEYPQGEKIFEKYKNIIKIEY